jgi:hypothetical protein
MASLNVYIVTFNCGGTAINANALQTCLLNKLPKDAELPDVLVLCLQELAPRAVCFLGGPFLTSYFDAFRRAVEGAAAFRDNMSYVNTFTRNVGFTAIMVFVRQDQKKRVAWLETAGVGFGLWGMANKGSVGLRMGYKVDHDADDVMEMAFVSAHLAAHEGQKYLAERRQDWRTLVQGLVFTLVGKRPQQRVVIDREGEDAPLLQGIPDDAGGFLYQGARSRTSLDDSMIYGMYKPTSHLFFAGDLNFRTSATPPTKEDYERYPQPTEDTENAKHYSHLLPHDELKHEMDESRVLQGLSEHEIDFPPTYKYNTSAMKSPVQDDDVPEWPWTHRRWPSWCDRVLWMELPAWMRYQSRASKIVANAYGALPLLKTSDHRPVALSISIPLMSIPAPEPDDVEAEAIDRDQRIKPPFNLDPRWREKRASARWKEIVVGMVMYLSWTYEGWILLLSIVLGILGGNLLIQRLLSQEGMPPPI